MVTTTMTRRLRTLLVAFIATFGIATASPAVAGCTGPMCMVRARCASASMPLAPRPCCVKAMPQGPAIAPVMAHQPANPLVAAAAVAPGPLPVPALNPPTPFGRPPAHGHRTRPLSLLLSTFLI